MKKTLHEEKCLILVTDTKKGGEKRGKCNEILNACPLFTFIVFASIEKEKNKT